MTLSEKFRNMSDEQITNFILSCSYDAAEGFGYIEREEAINCILGYIENDELQKY